MTSARSGLAVDRGGCRDLGQRAKIADLLIAAAAEAAGLVVLHYDHDFDFITEITGQPNRMDPARGTLVGDERRTLPLSYG